MKVYNDSLAFHELELKRENYEQLKLTGRIT